jgi:predicted amidohydrolase
VTATVALVKARPEPGAVGANQAAILQYARQADQLGAAVIVFPELMLTGIGPDSPAADDDLRRLADEALTDLARTLDRDGLGGRHLVVGTTGTGLANLPVNAAAVLHKGKVELEVTDQDTRPMAVFAARGQRFGLALGRAAPGGGRAGDLDAVLVLADQAAHVSDLAGNRVGPAAPEHDGLTLCRVG